MSGLDRFWLLLSSPQQKPQHTRLAIFVLLHIHAR